MKELINPWESYHFGCDLGARDFAKGFAMRNKGIFDDCMASQLCVDWRQCEQTQRNTMAYFHKGYRKAYRSAKRIHAILEQS